MPPRPPPRRNGKSSAGGRPAGGRPGSARPASARPAGGRPPPRGAARPAPGKRPAAPRPAEADEIPAALFGADDDDAITPPTTGSLAPKQKKGFLLASFLKFHDLAETGGQAKWVVRAGTVKVNGEPELRPGRQLVPGDVVEVDGKPGRFTVA